METTLTEKIAQWGKNKVMIVGGIFMTLALAGGATALVIHNNTNTPSTNALPVAEPADGKPHNAETITVGPDGQQVISVDGGLLYPDGNFYSPMPTEVPYASTKVPSPAAIAVFQASDDQQVFSVDGGLLYPDGNFYSPMPTEKLLLH